MIGSGLFHNDMVCLRNDWNNKKLWFIGIYSKNSVWVFTIDIACIIYGITSVNIYD